MKTNAISRIVLFSLAILILTGLLLGGIGATHALQNLSGITRNLVHHFETDEPIQTGNLKYVTSFDAADVRDIQIEWTCGSIAILPSSEDHTITISETEVSKEQYRMKYRLSGNKLIIEFDDTDVYFGFSFDTSKDLLIRVPRDWSCNTLEIDTASARVDVSDIDIREFDFDGASGECNITNCTVEELDLDTASGDITFDGTLNILDCDAASASCRITVHNTPKIIEIDTASGDLDLTLPEDCGFSCDMQTLSGSFHSDFETTIQNGTHIHGDGSCRISVDAMSGNVNIRKHAGQNTDHHSE